MTRVFNAVRPLRKAWLGLSAVLMLALQAFAAPVSVPATPTSMTSTAVRMVSYRHQDHMWQTPDGATHALVNTGNQPDGKALRMHTSLDNGVTWTPGIALTSSTENSTSDGFIVGNQLFATYQTAAGAIAFVRLTYDPVMQVWLQTGQEVAFQSSAVFGVNPSLARDALGRFWLAFTAMDKASGQYSIRMLSRVNGTGWADTGLQFGVADSVSIERSARPVATRNGMGLVYTVHQTTFWAFRANDAALNAPWPAETVYVRKSPETDPFSSHFSLVADKDFNLHMVMVDDGRALYFRQPAGAGHWKMITVTEPASTVYAQMVISGSRLLMIANHKSLLRVFESLDQGTTWANTLLLTHAYPTPTTDYQRPRVEAPAHAGNPVPVLQQYVEDGVQRLMSFQVPVTSESAGRQR